MIRYGLIIAAVTLLVPVALADAGQREADPTFAKDVAPILFERCVVCHRPGEVAPMSLTSYETVRPWSRAIKAKVESREMPPWHADPAFGRFRNDRSLTHDEIDTIVRWVDAGAPRGNDADLPVLPSFAEGWQGEDGPPDHVFVMPEYEVAAEGEIPYMNFYVRNTLPEDKFLRAIEMRPGNPRVVHHSRIDVVKLPSNCHVDDDGVLMANEGGLCPDDPAGGVFDAPKDTGERFFVTAFVPGHSYERYAPGTGKRLTAGLWFRFNMHYQATGVVENDATRLGLWFSREPVTHEVFTRSVGNSLPTEPEQSRYVIDGREYVVRPDVADEETEKTAEATLTSDTLPNIPPFAGNWKITSVTPVTEPITLYNLWPHMHLRGKDMMWIVTWPDGTDEVILSVPKYDFNWQLQYELDEPLRLPAGSKLTAVGHYDNSLRNRYNPAPEREVYWAEQSWDEMFIPYIEYTVDSLALTEAKESTDQQ